MHYAVHSGPEALRHRFNVLVSLHDLYDTYTPAFRATVMEAHADSVMCAYNSVRDEPACANGLLFDLLRNKWGFHGYVVSDCWAINDLYQGHGFVQSLNQAAALSVKAGTDLSCGPQFKALDRAVEDRLLAPTEGDYRLGASSDGGYRLYLDGKLLVDDWAPHGERAMTTLVHLQAGHAYAVKLEYFHHSWESAVRLLWLPPNLTQEALDAARKSDAVIAVVGITAQLEGEESESNDPGFFGGDRTDTALPEPQQQLLESLAATGKPLIVVLTSGSALAVNWADEHAAAILEAWYPGEEGGAAVAEVLSGQYNPAGRLPVTFYKSLAQIPPFNSYSMFGRTYRYFTEQPPYPFGYGLSYSSFTYEDAKVSAPETDANSNVTVSVRVTNSSPIVGDEIVQLYVSHPGMEGAPLRALTGFQRLHLAPHASQTITLTLSPRELSIVDPAGNRVVPAGPVELWIGSGQPAVKSAHQPSPNGQLLKLAITNTASLPN